jgi:hypothetical protein
MFPAVVVQAVPTSPTEAVLAAVKGEEHKPAIRFVIEIAWQVHLDEEAL